MVIEKDILSLKDVAEICGTSNSNVSNWRTRDTKFPAPYAETASGPLWKAEDIVTYLQNKFKDEYDVIATGNLSSKRVAVIGRARGGKSFFISRFVLDRKGFILLFCGNNKDKTACPIYVKVSEYITLESFIFHSNFNSIYDGEDEKDDDLMELNREISSLLDHSYPQDSVDIMKKIEEVIRKIRDVEVKYPNRRNSDTYIDTYQRPSEFCKGLLRECKLGTIEIVDTPGVSGNVEAARIAKSDIYFFVLRPDNSDEAKTLRRIVTAIKADVATSKVAFLYKTEGIYSSKEEYEEAREEVHEDMASYNALFDELKGSIISTDVDILDPAGHCIAFPTMNKVNVSFQEEFFLEDVMKKMIAAFKPEDESSRDTAFVKLVAEHGKAARNLVLSIMKNIPIHSLGEGDKLYSTDQVIAGKHDRVMTKDGYKLHNDLYDAYSRESTILDKYFSSFVVTDYPEEWQQLIIKYVHRKLTSSIRSDRGLGVGTHPWEERPARTMLIEESILADSILKNILGKDERFRNEPYRQALRDNNITSATWNYVGCINDSEAIKKLQIIKECLLDVKVSSIQEMVLCRYVGGLRKVAQYEILQKLGFDENDCMEEIKTLPF